MYMPRRLLPLLAAALFSGGSAMANEAGFDSKAAAMDYLAATLPQATAANPDYRTVKDGTVTRWLTKAVRFFGQETAGPVSVAMQETYTETKDGETTPAAHEAAFSLAEVEVSELTEPGDVTPEGAAARGVLFACTRPGCIAAKWREQPSVGDRTDIYLQDDAVRAKVLAAFQYLKGAK